MPDFVPILPKTRMLLGIAADHGGYELKEYLAGKMREAGHEVIDFGVASRKKTTIIRISLCRSPAPSPLET